MQFMRLVLAGIALVASPAAAQTIEIRPGETVTVRFDHDKAVVEQRGPADSITKFDAYTLWRAETQELPPGAKVVPPQFVLKGEGPPNPPHPTNERLQITMRRVPSVKEGGPDNTALFISNGFASTLRYRAAVQRGSQSTATDVCDVAPNLPGLEHWPYLIDKIELSDLRLVEWTGSIACQ